MVRTSWLKKIWSGRSKGVSTVVGTVFLMLIIFMVSANVLIWTFSQNAEYNQAVMEKNEEEAERRGENVVASDVEYSVDGDKVTVETELENEGSVAAQIVNLWVLDSTMQEYGFNETIESLNLNLNPGDKKTVSAVVTIPGASESHTFDSWFLTGRGNTIPLEEDEVAEYVESHPWIDIGLIRFRFEHDSLNFTSDSFRDPLPGWTVPGLPGGEPIMFHVKIINTGKVAVHLLKHCVFYLLEYRSGQGGAAQQAYPFYIVDPDSTYPSKKSSEDEMYPYDEEADPYVLQPNPEGKWWLGGSPVIVKFGSKGVGGDTSISLDANCEYLAFIGFYYTYIDFDDGEPRQLGQTIPFVAVRSVNPYVPPPNLLIGPLYFHRTSYIPYASSPSPGYAMDTTSPAGGFTTMNFVDKDTGGTAVYFYQDPPTSASFSLPNVALYKATIWVENPTGEDADLYCNLWYYDSTGALQEIPDISYQSTSIPANSGIIEIVFNWPVDDGWTMPADGGFVFEIYCDDSSFDLYYDGVGYPSNIYVSIP